MPLVIFSSVSIAEISIGADITSSANRTSQKAELASGTTTERITNQNTIVFGPQIGILPSKLIEIAPFFRWGVTTSSSENITEGTSSSSTKTESSQHFMEPGCGLYFHVVNNNNILDFSLGPKLSYAWAFEPSSKNSSGSQIEYDEFYNGTLNFGIQTNIDLKFSEHFKARLFSNLFRLSLLNTHTKAKGSTTDNRSTTFVSDFRTLFQPAFGFHFTF